jgi:uncharacterized protein (DUF362 family)
MADPLIAIVKTSPRTVLEDYNRLLICSEYQKVISPDIRTILKLNLSWSLYFPACSSEPWQVEGVIKTLRRDGYMDLMAVENRTVVTNIEKGLEGNKWNPVLKKYDVPMFPLTEAEWIPYRPKGSTPALDKIFRGSHRIPREIIGTNVIHLPTVKTHGHTIMTGAMKNAFGGLITERRHHCHRYIHEVLVDLLTLQNEIHPGIFAVMDGTVCGDGNGPRAMMPVIGNILLAGQDMVAIDAISAMIMGYDPMTIPFIKMAHDKGLGCGDPAQIEISGDDIKGLNLHFTTGKSLVIKGDQLFRKGRMSFFEPLIFHTPLFWLAIKSSWFYHDIYWYNTIGRSRISQFRTTEWGKLFESY